MAVGWLRNLYKPAKNLQILSKDTKIRKNPLKPFKKPVKKI
jgi:hypothetical protein